MNHRTHLNFSRVLFPNMRVGKLDKINSAIDNPSKEMALFNNMFNTISVLTRKGKKKYYYNPYDILGLSGTAPHRRTNHDVLTAAYAATLAGGPGAIAPAMVHLLLDDYSEQIKKSHGVSARDYMEAAWNWNFQNIRDRQKAIKMAANKKRDNPITMPFH